MGSVTLKYAIPPDETTTTALTTAEEHAFALNHLVPDLLSSFNVAAAVTVTYTDPVTDILVNVTPGGNLTIERECFHDPFKYMPLQFHSETTYRPQFSLQLTDAIRPDDAFVLIICQCALALLLLDQISCCKREKVCRSAPNPFS